MKLLKATTGIIFLLVSQNALSQSWFPEAWPEGSSANCDSPWTGLSRYYPSEELKSHTLFANAKCAEKVLSNLLPDKKLLLETINTPGVNVHLEYYDLNLANECGGLKRTSLRFEISKGPETAIARFNVGDKYFVKQVDVSSCF
ncbi:MAG: hypothetical protein AB7O96_05785 [Pseudobdellovibrionaceae bacterium]